MSDHATTGDDERRNHVPQLAEGAEEEPAVESYETEDGVVFYDADNPLAWLKASNATPLAQQR